MNAFLAFSNPIYLHSMSIRTIMHKAFVYGTLKQQQPNHHWLEDPNNGISKFLSKGRTKTKYPLIIATKYNIPFLLYCPGTGNNVEGEIYEVDDQMLGRLDILEDHPNYYVREKEDIVVKDPNTDRSETVNCWVYFLKNFKPELLKRPFLEDYSSTGTHGLKYLDRSKRDPLYNLKEATQLRKKTDCDTMQ